MSNSEYATDAEVLEAIDQGRKEALAKKATAEIMAKTQGEPGFDPNELPPLKNGEYPMPDPPSDAILMAMQQALRPLNEKLQGAHTHDRDDFDKEIRGRFAEYGIIVDVKWWYSNEPGAYIPEVEPYAVTDHHGRSIVGHKDYDPDQQVHQVVNDEMNTGQKGTVSDGKSQLWTPG